MTERIDTLSQAPVVGRWYLVRSLTYDRFHRGVMTWPIIGPKHRDIEFFNFNIDHYHLDVRFLTKRHLRSIGEHYSHGEFGFAFSQPCQPTNGALPKPALARMQCRRTGAEYPYWDRKAVKEINAAYKGAPAKRTKHGWTCPHRNAPLANHVPFNAA